MIGPIVAAALAVSTPQARPEPVMVLGIGNRSCAEWVDVHRQASTSTAALQYDSWLMGYLSALNEWVLATNRNITEGVTDNLALAAWITNHCQANPLDTVSGAARQLVTELARRRAN